MIEGMIGGMIGGMSRFHLPLAVLLAALALAACGKKGAPSPEGPPDQVTYPRVYPAY